MDRYRPKPCHICDDPDYKLTDEEMTRRKSDTKAAIHVWCFTHSVYVERQECAVVDTRSFELYPIDFIARKHNKVHTVIVFHTRKRIPKHRYDEVLQYARDMHAVCVQLYAMCPTTLVLNTFPATTTTTTGPTREGDTRSNSNNNDVDIIQISRNRWSGQRRRRQNGGGVSVPTTRLPRRQGPAGAAPSQ